MEDCTLVSHCVFDQSVDETIRSFIRHLKQMLGGGEGISHWSFSIESFEFMNSGLLNCGRLGWSIFVFEACL